MQYLHHRPNCQNNQCINSCIPDCTGKFCGIDGCSGSCGTCATGQTCNASGQCVSNCTANYSKKCDAGNLYWYDSCGNKGDLYQNCGTNTLTTNYQCSGNWLQQGMVAKDCVSGAVPQAQSWSNVQNCALTGKICKNSACATNDAVPPVLSGLAPSGTTYNANVVLTVTTNESADCRYGSSDKSYDLLTSQFSSSDKLYHSASVVLSGFSSYTYYVRCKDAAGNASPTSSKVSFKYASATAVIPPKKDPVTVPPADIAPPIISKSSLAPSGDVGATPVTISLATDEKATCKYDTADGSYEAMKNTMDGANNGTSHSKSAALDAPGDYTYYIRCKDALGNAAKQSATIKFNYVIPEKKPGPAITGAQPAGTIYQKEVGLEVHTDKTAVCRYSTQDGDFQSMSGLFQTPDGQQQMAAVALDNYGDDRYYVRCQDEQGNVEGSYTSIAFAYKDPNEPAPTPPVEKICTEYTAAAADGTCEAAIDCVCDPDCPAEGDTADADCAKVVAEPKDDGNPGLVIAAVVGLVAVVIAIVLIVVVKNRNSDQEEDMGTDELL